MADQVCNALVSMLSSLSTMIDQERRLLGGVEGELQLIQIELSQMKALLEKVNLIQLDDPQFKEWIKQVRKVSFEIEDAIDEYAILFAHPPSGGLFGHIHSTLNSIKTCRARHRLAVRLQSINATLRTISETRSRYETKYATAAPPKDSWRYSKDDEALYARDGQLVGIETPKRELISKLLNGDSQSQVIAVQGMGGLGKTTLVKKVYDDAAVKSHFTMRAWVAVSQTYAVEKIFTSIIRQLRPNDSILSPPGSNGVGGPELKQHIRDILSEGRYVVVFDDVWDEGFWDEIKFALPENSYGGNWVLLIFFKYQFPSKENDAVQMIWQSIARNSALSVMAIFQLLCSIFQSLILKFRSGLKSEIGIFYPMLILRVLENVLQPSFLQKMSVLSMLHFISQDSQLIIDIFVNYDCDVDAPNIFQRYASMPYHLSVFLILLHSNICAYAAPLWRRCCHD